MKEPSMDESKAPSVACQLKITLVDSAPEVWRRIVIPMQISLAELHRVIQLSMGWEDLHSYQFRLGLSPHAKLLSAEQLLAQVLESAASQPLYYSYDTESGWLHRIEQEALETDLVSQPVQQLSLSVCTDGQSACPPESSGGVWGYDELLVRLEDPEDPDYLELIDAYGDFDPDAFTVAEANARLSGKLA